MFSVSQILLLHIPPCGTHRALVLSLWCQSLEGLQAAGPPFSKVFIVLPGHRVSVTSPWTQDLLFLLPCLPKTAYALPEIPFYRLFYWRLHTLSPLSPTDAGGQMWPPGRWPGHGSFRGFPAASLENGWWVTTLKDLANLWGHVRGAMETSPLRPPTLLFSALLVYNNMRTDQTFYLHECKFSQVALSLKGCH